MDPKAGPDVKPIDGVKKRHICYTSHDVTMLLTELEEWLANGWLVLSDKRDNGVIEDFLQRIPKAKAALK